MIQNKFNGKKVFVTGHTGFKGSWMIKCLSMFGADIKAYSLPPKNQKDNYNLIQASSICESEIGDIRDYDKLRKSICEFKPDFIFHLAAQSLVYKSYQDPLETYETNVMGTANLLLSLKSLNAPCVVSVITTDKVYKNKEWIYPYREIDQLGGYDPYSSSKACTEILVDSFRNSFFSRATYKQHGIQISTARAGNVIGGGDWAENRIVPDIVRSILSNKVLELRSPKAVRPWQHVLEPLNGYFTLAEKMYHNPLKYDGEWNFGPDNKSFTTVEDLTRIAIDALGKGSYKDISDKEKLHETSFLLLENFKSKRYLNWKPQMSDKKAIEWTVEWYKQFLEDRSQCINITENQIKSYFKF